MQSNLLNIAIEAVRVAGKIICQAFDQTDIVDAKVAEHVAFRLEQIITKSFPKHNVAALGKFTDNDGDCTWFIEPVDGVYNANRGYQQFATTIAIKIQDAVTHSIIFNPLTHDLYTAGAGNGARLNDRRIRITKTNKLQNACFALEPNSTSNEFDKIINKTLSVTNNIRIIGCPALALAHTTAGQNDAFIGFDIPANTLMAAELLIRESGGFFGGLEPEDTLPNKYIIASNRALYPAVCNLLK